MRYLFVFLPLLASSAIADPGQIPFPENYKSFTPYLSLDRTQNPDQIIHLFADDTALSGLDEGGQLPYGATLVAEIYKAKKDDKGEVIESALGERLQGALAAVAVMQRREGADADYPEDARNDDWDFAIFKPNGEKLDKDLVACAACHAPLADRHHLFSYQHIVNAQP